MVADALADSRSPARKGGVGTFRGCRSPRICSRAAQRIGRRPPRVPHRPQRKRNVLAVIRLGVVVAALGCSPSEVQVSEQPTGIRCGESQRLELELGRVIPIGNRTAPAGAAAFGPEAVLVLEGGGSLALHGEGYLPPSVADLVFRGVASHGTAAVAYSDNSLVRLSTAFALTHVLPDDLVPVRSIAADPETGRLWIVSGQAGIAGVHAATIADEGSRIDIHPIKQGLEGNWRVLPHSNGALLVGTAFPFPLRRLNLASDQAELQPLAAAKKFPRLPDSAAPYVVGTTPLDCGRGLVTIADARSTLRTLVVVGLEGGEVERVTQFEASMGFFDSRPKTKELFAYRMTEDGGEVLLYRWRWVADA